MASTVVGRRNPWRACKRPPTVKVPLHVVSYITPRVRLKPPPHQTKATPPKHHDDTPAPTSTSTAEIIDGNMRAALDQLPTQAYNHLMNMLNQAQLLQAGGMGSKVATMYYCITHLTGVRFQLGVEIMDQQLLTRLRDFMNAHGHITRV